MKPFIAVIVAALSVTLVGCGTPEQREIARHAHDIKIDSDPQGMRVYFSTDPKNPIQEYVGTTPCTYTPLRGKDDGFEVKTVSKYEAGMALFTAQAPYDHTNLFEQTVRFKTWAKYQHADKIPSALFFDMHKQ